MCTYVASGEVNGVIKWKSWSIFNFMEFNPFWFDK